HDGARDEGRAARGDPAAARSPGVTSPPVIAGIGEMLWDVYPERAHFGGAPANFACHAASLGAESWMVSAVGNDPLGHRALDALGALGVRCDLVQRDVRHPTGRVLVTLDSAGQPQYDI